METVLSSTLMRGTLRKCSWRALVGRPNTACLYSSTRRGVRIRKRPPSDPAKLIALMTGLGDRDWDNEEEDAARIDDDDESDFEL